MSGLRVLGVDGCRAGWAGIGLSDAGVSAYFSTEIGELAEQAGADGAVEVVGIDMPIGLADAGRRRADVLARGLVGPLWASVFMTPVRAAVETEDYVTAAALNVRLAGEGISRQAFGLAAKILQVDAWVRGARPRVVEVHPEVSFAFLNGGPLAVRKSTWAGMSTRRRLLASVGIELPDDLGLVGSKAAVDDILDAAVVAWTAVRVARGEARQVPDPAEVFSDGIPAAIHWLSATYFACTKVP